MEVMNHNAIVFSDSSNVSWAISVFLRRKFAMERAIVLMTPMKEIAVREFEKFRQYSVINCLCLRLSLQCSYLDFCTKDEFYCPSGKCVPWSSTCDELWDCVDGSDEPNVCRRSENGLTGIYIYIIFSPS